MPSRSRRLRVVPGDQLVDIEASDRARRAEIRQRLDNRTQFRNIARLLFALQLIFRLPIEEPKRLAYDLAALVADDVKHEK